ncbi:restriction endonuclease subunit S [Nannocystaceae bacterium ST9]
MIAGRLGDFCIMYSGGTPPRSTTAYYGGAIPWAKIADLNVDTGIVYETEESITPAGLNSIGNRMFPAGTILLAMYGSVGKLAVAGCEISANQAILGIAPKSEGILNRSYLRWWLEHIKPRLISDARGVTQANISKSIVENMPIRLPPLDEQIRIAAILDKAESIHRRRQEAIALTDQLIRATFIEMFGNPVERGWSMTTVDKLANPDQGSIRTGPFGSQLLHSEFVESGVPVLGIDNVVDNIFRWAKPRFISDDKYASLRRYTVHPGDVLITIMGTCGRCAIAPESIPTAINTKHICCITLDRRKCLPEFLHSYFLHHPIAREYLAGSAKGAIMDGLNMGIIKELPVPEVPLTLQLRYQRFVFALSKMNAVCEANRESSNALFESLNHRAFTGQL